MNNRPKRPGSSRRKFLTAAAWVTGALWIPAHRGAIAKTTANDKLNIGIIGVGGQGAANTERVKSENIVALCDVDRRRLAEAAQKYPDAQTYVDWRKLLDQKGLDAVVISTTDHTHAPASCWAMKRGLGVFCEKPLAHSVYEARVVQELCQQTGVATQHGTQMHATDHYRRVVELVKSGAIGPVHEVHVWCGRIGPSPTRPKDEPPVPEYLEWDLWLGPAPWRPYHPSYLPGCTVWEQWWDFGNGCLGDMGSHLIDLPFWALDLGDPLTVEAEGSHHNPEAYPHWLIARWEHPAKGDRPAVRLTWYDGIQRPPSPPGHDLSKWGIGVMFVGEKGMLLADYSRKVLLPEDHFKDFEPPQPWIPSSPGHYAEWIQACKTGSPTLCNFVYAGKLIEHNLLGTVAFRAKTKLEWDPGALKAKNCPEADAFIRRPYREGWSLLPS